MRTIWVTGNGFDLCMGKKTGYLDFVRCVEAAFGKRKDERSEVERRLTELCNVNGFFRHFHFLMAEDASWNFFELEMTAIVGALAGFEDVVLERQKDPEFDIIEFNIIAGVFTYRDLQIFKHFARIFEQVLDDPSGGMYKLRQLYVTQDRTLDTKAMIGEVRRELDSFTAALDLYLTSCAQEDGCAAGAAAGMRGELPDYVINMNFTDTVCSLGVPEERVFFAKGRAGSDPVNLVLGCPDDSEDPPDWIWFRNYFQRLVKGIGLPDREALRPTDENGVPVPVTVRYLGYSFPEGDAELLRGLFEVAQTSVICCKDREDYAYKVLALIRLLGKREAAEAIDGGKLTFVF